MSYAIIRNANYKKDNLAGLYKHNERKNINYSNKDINKNNLTKNYSIKKCNTTYFNALKILQKQNDLKGRIIKTTNVICEFIITSDKEFFETIGEEETKRYFQTAYNFVAQYKNLGEKYIISAKVHLDETTPHMHLVFVPVIHTLDKKSGRTKENTHIPIETLKQITNYDNIKYEINNEQIQQVKTEDTNLILEQNKELVEYTNKLKMQLSKSLVAINKVTNLETENTILKQENKKLTQENIKLKNYIEKTFDVVKQLFSFPIDRFKKLVDSFVHHFEK